MTPEPNLALRVLCTGVPAAAGTPAWQGLPWGAMDLQVCDDITALAAAHARAPADAWLVGVAGAQSPALWPALAPAALQTAVVLVLPLSDTATAQPWLDQGVQDLVPQAEATPQRLALALWLAVQRKRLEVAARHAYATDLSTGLPNHPQLLEHMTHLLALREREPAPMALIVLRLHGLAQTGAQLGPEAANVLRRKAAVRLRASLRASDVVASMGSDALAVLLAWMDAPEDGDGVARKLAQALAEPYTVAGREQRLQLSVGLARYPEHGKDAQALLGRALAQAATLATLGSATPARAADRGPAAAANDE